MILGYGLDHALGKAASNLIATAGGPGNTWSARCTVVSGVRRVLQEGTLDLLANAQFAKAVGENLRPPALERKTPGLGGSGRSH